MSNSPTDFYNKKNFAQLEDNIGIDFHNKELLAQSFVHRSYFYEAKTPFKESNERLEFLGDAVLELIVTHHLYHNYDEAEGILTKWRAALVNTRSLSRVARELDLDQYILLSQGEKLNKQGRACILADVVEALIGAIYLDDSWKQAKEFVENYIISKLSQIIKKGSFRDPKSTFQEFAQEELNITPEYKILTEQGPDHDKEFEVGVYLEEELIGRGRGSSKQEAERQAASQALNIKNWS